MVEESRDTLWRPLTSFLEPGLWVLPRFGEVETSGAG